MSTQAGAEVTASSRIGGTSAGLVRASVAIASDEIKIPIAAMGDDLAWGVRTRPHRAEQAKVASNQLPRPKPS